MTETWFYYWEKLLNSAPFTPPQNAGNRNVAALALRSDWMGKETTIRINCSPVNLFFLPDNGKFFILAEFLLLVFFYFWWFLMGLNWNFWMCNWPQLDVALVSQQNGAFLSSKLHRSVFLYQPLMSLYRLLASAGSLKQKSKNPFFISKEELRSSVTKQTFLIKP